MYINEEQAVYCSFKQSEESSSDSDSSIASGIIAASSMNLLQSLTDLKDSMSRPKPIYHKTAAMWAHIPTTLAPARHLQYHPITLPSSYRIQRR